jgi:hypothetical protein
LYFTFMSVSIGVISSLQWATEQKAREKKSSNAYHEGPHC